MTVLVAIEGATLGYEGRPVVESVGLEIRSGELWFVCGPNGAGKSTLLKAMLGLLDPMRGAVRRAPQTSLGYVQQGFALPASVPTSVRELVALGSLGLREPRRRREARWRSALETAGIAELAGTSFHELSGGQKRRTLIARALTRDANCLLLDEPTAGLDLRAAEALLDLLTSLQRDRGLAVVCVAHEIENAFRIATHVALVANRRVVAGPRADVLTPKRIEAAYGVALRVGGANDR